MLNFFLFLKVISLFFFGAVNRSIFVSIMIYYQEARRIYYNLKEGEIVKYKKKDFAKVQQSLNVVKRRHRDQGKKFKTKKKDGSVERIAVPVEVLPVVS